MRIKVVIAGSLLAFNIKGANLHRFVSLNQSRTLLKSPLDCMGNEIIASLNTDTNHRHGPKESATVKPGDNSGPTRTIIKLIEYDSGIETPVFNESLEDVHGLIVQTDEAVSVCPIILILLFDPFLRKGTQAEIIRLKFLNNRYRRFYEDNSSATKRNN
jgi:hypothetical protein